MNPRTKDTIRLQGVATVFVAGGPLAISDAVVDELEGHRSPTSVVASIASRRPEHRAPKKLIVIRIYGQTLCGHERSVWLSSSGAQPPAAFGPFGANAADGNPFNTAGGISRPVPRRWLR